MSALGAIISFITVSYVWADMRRFTEVDVQEIKEIEAKIGKTMFRPKRHQGAKGINEVMQWANAPRGKYREIVHQENLLDCIDGWCGI